MAKALPLQIDRVDCAAREEPKLYKSTPVEDVLCLLLAIEHDHLEDFDQLPHCELLPTVPQVNHFLRVFVDLA